MPGIVLPGEAVNPRCLASAERAMPSGLYAAPCARGSTEIRWITRRPS